MNPVLYNQGSYQIFRTKFADFFQKNLLYLREICASTAYAKMFFWCIKWEKWTCDGNLIFKFIVSKLIFIENFLFCENSSRERIQG